MEGDRVYLFDTTLRDGGQTRGVDYSVADKQAIARALDEIGVDYIEGGWPGANPTDDLFFASPPPLRRAKLVAFGMTRRPGRSADNDPGLAAILNVGTPATCLVGKTWDFHVDVALEIDRDENLAMIADSIAAAAAKGLEPMFDCEHFFDGFKANRDFALACAKTAAEAGARWVVLCDTNGGTLPHEVSEIVAAVTEVVPGAGWACIATMTPKTRSPTRGRGARRLPPGAGHHQRAGRALRQRQSDLVDPRRP